MTSEPERCGKRIRGLYGAVTFCAREKGHVPQWHTPNDGIWRPLPDVAAAGVPCDGDDRETLIRLLVIADGGEPASTVYGAPGDEFAYGPVADAVLAWLRERDERRDRRTRAAALQEAADEISVMPLPPAGKAARWNTLEATRVWLAQRGISLLESPAPTTNGEKR